MDRGEGGGDEVVLGVWEWRTDVCGESFCAVRYVMFSFFPVEREKVKGKKRGQG